MAIDHNYISSLEHSTKFGKEFKELDNQYQQTRKSISDEVGNKFMTDTFSYAGWGASVGAGACGIVGAVVGAAAGVAGAVAGAGVGAVACGIIGGIFGGILGFGKSVFDWFTGGDEENLLKKEAIKDTIEISRAQVTNLRDQAKNVIAAEEIRNKRAISNLQNNLKRSGLATDTRIANLAASREAVQKQIETTNLEARLSARALHRNVEYSRSSYFNNATLLRKEQAVVDGYRQSSLDSYDSANKLISQDISRQASLHISAGGKRDVSRSGVDNANLQIAAAFQTYGDLQKTVSDSHRAIIAANDRKVLDSLKLNRQQAGISARAARNKLNLETSVRGAKDRYAGQSQRARALLENSNARLRAIDIGMRNAKASFRLMGENVRNEIASLIKLKQISFSEVSRKLDFSTYSNLKQTRNNLRQIQLGNLQVQQARSDKAFDSVLSGVGSTISAYNKQLLSQRNQTQFGLEFDDNLNIFNVQRDYYGNIISSPQQLNLGDAQIHSIFEGGFASPIGRDTINAIR